LTTTEFAIRAWLAQLTRQTGCLLTWEQRGGVHFIRRDGMLIGSMTSLAAVETFLHGFERALQSPALGSAEVTAPGELDQAA
jgi:hypothetical protein